MTTRNLPTGRLLASYWLPTVGIGESPNVQYVDVPLLDIARYVRNDGDAQTNVVMLFGSTFSGTPDSFEAPYIAIPPSIERVLVAAPGEAQSDVQRLQALGIKVLLSVVGATQMGWDAVPETAIEPFAAWLRTEVVDRYGLDGIDIDNEWGGAEDTQNFVDLIGALRYELSGKLLHKGLWLDYEYFKVPVSSGAPHNAGAYLSSLIDFGSTLGYGFSVSMQLLNAARYHTLRTPSGEDIGLAREQICIGVQAGPPSAPWMTRYEDVSALARAVVDPTAPLLGMMLFSFSQDIRQFTVDPQNAPGNKFPNPGDHAWQKAIVEGMWGPKG